MLAGSVIGDPHILTPDGIQYTYNGLGEFWLQKPTGSPTDEYFQLQGRTSLALDAEGNTQRATVFSAIAAKDHGTDRVHIALTEDRQS